MKNQLLNPASAITPPSATPSNDQPFLITRWLGLYEGHLFRNSPHGTYERYSRVLSKFYELFPNKRFTYEFLRPDIETYKAQRLLEGASATTVNIELSVIRGFWKWMLGMEADGVMLNPALGVRVKVEKEVQRKMASQGVLESPPSPTL